MEGCNVFVAARHNGDIHGKKSALQTLWGYALGGAVHVELIFVNVCGHTSSRNGVRDCVYCALELHEPFGRDSAPGRHAIMYGAGSPNGVCWGRADHWPYDSRRWNLYRIEVKQPSLWSAIQRMLLSHVSAKTPYNYSAVSLWRRLPIVNRIAAGGLREQPKTLADIAPEKLAENGVTCAELVSAVIAIANDAVRDALEASGCVPMWITPGQVEDALKGASAVPDSGVSCVSLGAKGRWPRGLWRIDG